MVQSRAAPDTTLTLRTGEEAVTLQQGEQMVLVTRTARPEVKVEDSGMVFVGYGVVAPESGWNDYEGVDVKGKTVVMLVNDPGFHADDPELFGGKRMTYYGRWTYKYEEAARQGAAAALIIHDEAGAGYGWDVVKNSWTGDEFDLPAEVDPAPRIPLQGWLTQDAAQSLFEGAGLDLAALRTAANKPGFKAVPMDSTFSATLKTTTSTGESRNVLGLLKGSSKPDEVVIYIAHWDHLGTNPDLEGDQIFNGAIDNASGVAGVLEIAEAFVTANPKPERSVLFMPVTLEESGLLGARYYVANPAIPLEKTVAVINLDALRGEMVGPTKDVVVIGHGSSELEDILTEAAAKQQRTVEAEAEPEKGFYYRSDHFNFAKAGVPALYAKSGIVHVDQGREYGLAQQMRYTSERYHKPGDEYDPSWDLRGVVQDLQLFHRVGATLAYDPARWPNWYEGTEFRAARDAMLAD
jgi:Zn-dependent M28 family amino/carboxypeptidase